MTEMFLPRISVTYLPSSSRRPLIGHVPFHVLERTVWVSSRFEVPVFTIVLDLITGGKFSLSMHSEAHGVDASMDAHFLEVVEGERLVYTEPEPCLPEINDGGASRTVVVLAAPSGGHAGAGYLGDVNRVRRMLSRRTRVSSPRVTTGPNASGTARLHDGRTVPSFPQQLSRGPP
jgi:hypothetical protein